MKSDNKEKRLTRITSILIHLQSKRIVRAKEMSDRFEVSLRTVYRDIKTLQDAGVPIGSINGAGYYIMDGYALPPIMLSEEETNALLISEQLVLDQGDKSLIKDYTNFVIKIKSILKGRQKSKLAILENRIGPSSKDQKDDSNCLTSIQKAIVNYTVLKINYHSNSKKELTSREIEPLAISFTNKSWYVIAHCRLRNQMREFRLSRIRTLDTLPKVYRPRENFKLNSYYEQVGTY